MALLSRAIVVLLLLSVVWMPTPASAADDGPMTMDDIVKLRRKRATYEEVVDEARKRGLAFDIDKKIEGRLRIMRFKPDHIEALKQIKENQDKPKTGPGAPGAGPVPADDPLARKALAEAPYGPRKSEPWHDGVLELIKAINAASTANLTMVPTRNYTVSAKKQYAVRYAKDVAKLEAHLRKTFPEPIKSGTNKKSTHIIILETRYEYENWVKAMFATYEQRGMQIGGGQDPKGMLLRAASFLMPTHAVMCLENVRGEDDRRHAVGYYVGHLAMRQFTEGRAPAAMVTGFGNYTETLLVGSPHTMVFSYTERKIDSSGDRWRRLVRERVVKREAGTIPSVMKYTTNDMKEPHYAEAWTFIETLTKAPEKFAKWVEAVRDFKRPKSSLEETYGMEESKIEKQWYKWAVSGR